MDQHDYVGENPAKATPRRQPPIHMILKPLASLELTIALFLISLILVFYGTIAQKYDSLNTVLDNYFYCWVAWVDLNLTSDFTRVFFSFRIAGTEEDRVTCSVPFFGGFTLGWAMVVNLIAAHVLRFQMSWKRSGIWILHAGMILLLVGEYVRANYALEDRMQLREGQSADYLFSLDRSEVVFLTSNDGKTDEVISIPGDQIEKAAGKEPISHPDLPFDVKVVKYMKNTTKPLPVSLDETNRATSGYGLIVKLDEAKEVSSIRGGGRINMPGSYLTLIDKQTRQELGTYVVGLHLEDAQKVNHGATEWRIAHRMKRTYLPYTIKAVKVERINWPNSEKPKEFKSVIQLDNPTTGESREVTIEMNSPLRYNGSTYYQSSMETDDNEKATGFQVVRNPGSTIPYIACIMITLGMGLHFLLKLKAFLAKRTNAPKATKTGTETTKAPRSFKRDWLVATGVCALAGLVLVMAAKPRSKSDTKLDLDGFGKIPVLYQGRYMPLDTVARHHLLLMSGGRQTYKRDSNDKASEPALKFMLEVMSGNDKFESFPVIRIVDLDVVQFLQLQRRPGSWRYSYTEVAEAFDKKQADVAKMAMKARNDQPLTETESNILSARGHLRTIDMMQALAFPGMVPDPDKEEKWLTFDEIDRREAGKYVDQARRESELQVEQRMREDPKMLEKMVQQFGAEKFRAVIEQIKQEAAIKRLKELLDEHRAEYAPPSAAFQKILQAYAKNDTAAFNSAVEAYHTNYVSQLPQEAIRNVGKEYFMNQFDPFFWCQWFYVGVMVLAVVSWLGWGRPLNNATVALAILTVIVHTFGLIMRMIISEKPPVTNLYSSAVFIGWGCVLLCIGMDLYYRHGIANFIGGLTGMATMLIARFLESNGDTMPRVEAVLNTNFWLSSHVTIVTLGYTATYVAGFLGLVYIIGAMFTNAFRHELGRTLYTMTYGTTCFATLLSFVGTVLGGFWADDSWGRFWGWDPKENGAVIIVIWNALILHMRWAGMVKARGFAVMALLGISITTWSWFGTNQLGIGLHAYGFDKNLADGCALCWIAVSLIGLLGCVPLQFWASFGPTNEQRTKS